MALSKKELKLAQKLAKLEKEKEEARQKTIKWLVIGVASFLFVALFVVLVVIGKQNQAGNSALVTVGPGDWIRGDRNAKTTLVEFSDFQCPACASYEPMVRRLLLETGGGMRLVYKHFPLTSIHRNAFLAAQAAEAAGLQGKFWEMHDILFEKQGEWAESNKAEDVFVKFAADLKLDVEKFRQDLASPYIKDKIQKNQEEGIKLGVNATPTFAINGKIIKTPRTYEEFKALVGK
jgi:protein-disulfide isomerase